MKRTKLRKGIAVCMAVTVFGLTGITASAGAERFTFYSMKNSGQNFSVDDTCGENNKTYAGQAWSSKVSTMTKSGYVGSGLGLILYKSGVATFKKASAICWAGSKGVRSGSWSPYSGATGTYRLYGRLDDVSTGTLSATGYWNADTIVNWP